jgi:hypothetical protein
MMCDAAGSEQHMHSSPTQCMAWYWCHGLIGAGPGSNVLLRREHRGQMSRRRETVLEEFTRDRLHGVAGKLGIAHGGVFESGLTWLGAPESILQLAKETLSIGRWEPAGSRCV